MLRFTNILAVCLLLGLLMNACAAEDPPKPPDLTPTAAAEPALAPTAAAPGHTPAATYMPLPTILPDSGWAALRPGLERRILNQLNAAGQSLERIYILRLDPAAFTFNVAYHPDPRTLEVWQVETGALVVVNGGYYRIEKDKAVPTGLTVINGQPSGASYGPFAGMFTVTADGPGLRWLERQPYDPSEPLIAALQSFPILVKPGGVEGFPASAEDNQPARRTAVARDTSGRILFIIAQKGRFTLHTFSDFLTASDLSLDFAINLDGGPSSGLLLADPREQIPAFTPLPIVITVKPR